jgi:Sulfotransferase family
MRRAAGAFARWKKDWQKAAVLESNIKELFDVHPPPIVDSRNKIILLWSAKAGCTFAIKWMFQHMDILKEAIAYRGWIHNYRLDILYPSSQHRASIEDFCRFPSSYRVVKFVRQPFQRTVSSYVHVLQRGQEDDLLAAHFGAGAKNGPRFSFREFVRYLGTVDLREGNIHYRLQTHPLERHLIPASMFLMNLDHSMNSLPKLETRLSLPETSPQLYRESRHHTRTSAKIAKQFNGDEVFDFSNSPPDVPNYRSFYDLELERAVFNVYAEDFLRYGFATTVVSKD